MRTPPPPLRRHCSSPVASSCRRRTSRCAFPAPVSAQEPRNPLLQTGWITARTPCGGRSGPIFRRPHSNQGRPTGGRAASAHSIPVSTPHVAPHGKEIGELVWNHPQVRVEPTRAHVERPGLQTDTAESSMLMQSQGEHRNTSIQIYFNNPGCGSTSLTLSVTELAKRAQADPTRSTGQPLLRPRPRPQPRPQPQLIIIISSKPSADACTASPPHHSLTHAPTHTGGRCWAPCTRS